MEHLHPYGSIADLQATPPASERLRARLAASRSPPQDRPRRSEQPMKKTKVATAPTSQRLNELAKPKKRERGVFEKRSPERAWADIPPLYAAPHRPPPSRTPPKDKPEWVDSSPPWLGSSIPSKPRGVASSSRDNGSRDRSAPSSRTPPRSRSASRSASRDRPAESSSAALETSESLENLGIALSRVSDGSQRAMLLALSRCLAGVLDFADAPTTEDGTTPPKEPNADPDHYESLPSTQLALRLTRALDAAVRRAADGTEQQSTLHKLAAIVESFAAGGPEMSSNSIYLPANEDLPPSPGTGVPLLLPQRPSFPTATQLLSTMDPPISPSQASAPSPRSLYDGLLPPSVTQVAHHHHHHPGSPLSGAAAPSPLSPPPPPPIADGLSNLQSSLLTQCAELRSMVERENAMTVAAIEARLGKGGGEQQPQAKEQPQSNSNTGSPRSTAGAPGGLMTRADAARLRRGRPVGGLFPRIGGEGGRFVATVLVPLLVMLASMALGWVWATYYQQGLPPPVPARRGAHKLGRKHYVRAKPVPAETAMAWRPRFFSTTTWVGPLIT